MYGKNWRKRRKKQAREKEKLNFENFYFLVLCEMRKKFSSFFVWCKMQCLKKNANQDAWQKPAKNFNTLLEPFSNFDPFSSSLQLPQSIL